MLNGVQLYVGKLVYGLVLMCVEKGVIILQYNLVVGIEKCVDGSWIVVILQYVVEVKFVFIVMGGSGLGLFSWFCCCIVLVGSFVVIIELLLEQQVVDLFLGKCFYVISKNIGNYFCLIVDNCLLFGG